MANGSTSYLCGLLRCSRSRSTPSPTRDDGLRGVEFSPRSSMASSTRDPAPAPAPATAASSSQAAPPVANVNNPELAGYFSPPAPRSLPRPDPLRDVRGFYAPEPAAAVQPNVRPWNARYS
ncbi:hypothetical protein F5Y13DRAFT_154769 [Hypoxylon sp. FL1857]|nr:hypothetical protein F5Y13DRAFT_154769 [Hypoxylon sp. FL1857]